MFIKILQQIQGGVVEINFFKFPFHYRFFEQNTDS